MKETAPFSEVVHQVNKAKFRQHVVNKLDVRVLGLIQVYVDISYQDGAFDMEELQSLL